MKLLMVLRRAFRQLSSHATQHLHEIFEVTSGMLAKSFEYTTSKARGDTADAFRTRSVDLMSHIEGSEASYGCFPNSFGERMLKLGEVTGLVQ